MLPRPPIVLVTLAAAVALAVTCFADPVVASQRQIPLAATRAAASGRASAYAQIACTFKNHIWVMNASGGDRRQITDSAAYTPAGESGPAWSPDGRLLAYVNWAGVTNDTGCRIWVVDADGSNNHRVNVLGSSESVLGTPAWSPDGRRIAFVNLMNIHVGYPEKAWEAVFSYDLGTGETTQIYSATKGDVIEGMTWSASGLKIEFSVDNSSAVQIGQINGRNVRLVSRLRSVALASHRAVTLARAPRGTCFMGIARSPNGRSLAVALSRWSGSQRSAILTGPMGGKPTHAVVKALQPSTVYQTVSWSPSARQLAYGIYTPNGYSTWMIGLNSKNDHKLLAGASSPAWRPR